MEKHSSVALALTAILFNITQLISQEEGVPISGLVLLPGGEPAAAARIGTGWWFDRTRLSAYGAQYVWPADSNRKANGWSFVQTDDEGRFDARVLPRKGKISLTIFSGDAAHAATFDWKSDVKLNALELRLERVARFRATIVCSDIGKRRVPATAYFNAAAPSRTRLGRFRVDRGVLDLLLPAGAFELYMYGAMKQDLAYVRYPIAVFAGDDVELADIDIPANSIALHRGRRMPPWHVTAARGISLKAAKMESFQGKWLLVELWSWRSSSPSRTIPKLIEFDTKWRAKHPQEDPPYAIILLHTSRAKSFAELDQKITENDFRRKHWKGRALPFPLLLDGDEKTRKAWGLRSSRKTLLFDPKGHLWGETREAGDLALAIAGSLEPAVVAPVRRKPAQTGKGK